MTWLYVIRHGRTVHNADRRIQGPLIDDGLAPEGRAQAEALARRFAAPRLDTEPGVVAPSAAALGRASPSGSMAPPRVSRPAQSSAQSPPPSRASPPLSHVYTSPMKRAHETAQPLARAAGVPLTSIPELVEFSWGIYLGQVEEGAVAEALRVHVERWSAGETDLAPPGGESPETAAARVCGAVARIVQAHPHEAVAVVAHGRVNKVLLSQFIYGNVANMEAFPQSNTGVSLLEGPAPWRARYVNDRSHLHGAGDARSE